MKYNQITRLILFGGAPLLVATVELAQNMGLEVFVYTSPRHAMEVLDEHGNTLQKKLNNFNVGYFVTDDINAEKTELFKKVHDQTLAIGMGEAWSFDEEIIKVFQGRLLDFMGIPHPRYRGGAHYTWMILRADRQMGCNLQVINKDMVQGEFDSGEIVKSQLYTLPDTVKTPLDYFNAAVPHEVKFIREFLEEIQAGKDFVLQLPDESRSLYLPRLNTLKQGWINWAWSGVEIERFIDAFDEPYAGASTSVNGERVHLKGALLDKSEVSFHPFQSGLITRITENEGVVIATLSGHLKVRRVLNANGVDIKNKLSIGDRLYTLQQDLEAALLVRVSYSAKK